MFWMRFGRCHVRRADPAPACCVSCQILHPGVCAGIRPPDGMRWLLVLAACSVLTDASPLHAASARGDVKKVRSLLERGMYGVDLQEADGSTALMVAAAFGYSSVVKQLLGSGANLELKDQTGMTALSWCACAKGREELIPQLMPAGAAAHAGRKVLKTYDQLGVTQLLLRQGAEIEALDFGGWSALMVASFYGQPEIATLLVEAGARTDHLSSEGANALDIATQLGHRQVVRIIRQSTTARSVIAAATSSELGWWVRHMGVVLALGLGLLCVLRLDARLASRLSEGAMSLSSGSAAASRRAAHSKRNAGRHGNRPRGHEVRAHHHDVVRGRAVSDLSHRWSGTEPRVASREGARERGNVSARRQPMTTRASSTTSISRRAEMEESAAREAAARKAAAKEAAEREAVEKAAAAKEAAAKEEAEASKLRQRRVTQRKEEAAAERRQRVVERVVEAMEAEEAQVRAEEQRAKEQRTEELRAKALEAMDTVAMEAKAKQQEKENEQVMEGEQCCSARIVSPPLFSSN